MIRGRCFNQALGCRKSNREGYVSVTAAVVRSRPCRWDTVAAAATAILATCSIVAAFGPLAPVVNIEHRSGYRHRCARTRPREGPLCGVWGGPSSKTFGTPSYGFSGRNPYVFVKSGISIAETSNCRLSLASVVEQTSTRDSVAKTSSSRSGGKKKTLASSRSLKRTRASERKEERAGSVSISTSSTATAPSLAAAESRKRDPPNLQRYYKTELLTAEEEYMLGMRVRLMVQCEAVHEGLTLALERPPTLEEWAAACGYNYHNSGNNTAQGVDEREERSIRPAGSTLMRSDRDPNMFVGNGLAGGAGVGRGNGRAKKAPPVELGQFWDDSAARFKKRQKSSKKVAAIEKSITASVEDAISSPQNAVLVNKGTVRDFVDMMILGREAKQRMIQCNMRLAVSIAKRYRNVGVNIADLVQEGSIGLARAAEKFDPKRGFKFSTYASW